MNSPETAARVEPLRKSVRVQAPPVHAFEVFTAGITRWWLPAHSINPTKSPIATVTIEPFAGGRWYERGVDGSECDWGRVLVWEPPSRVVLAWQIDASFKYDPAFLTEVEVRFEPLPGSATEVTLEHRLLDRFGAAGANLRNALDGGWGHTMESYAAATAERR